MLPKFGNFRVSKREVIIISIFLGFDQENHFLRSGLGPTSIIWGWH